MSCAGLECEGVVRTGSNQYPGEMNYHFIGAGIG